MKKLRTKEKLGLHPVMMLLVLSFITIIASGILRLFNVQATFNKISSVTGDFQVTTEAINSLFSLRGLKYIFTSTVSNFANFAVLTHLIIILLGIGIMVKSGFLKTIITLMTKKAKKTTVTFVLVLVSILASLVGDLSYIILVPLGALLFLYGKRNPMIGIITTFAALTCGSSLSLFITSYDSSLISMTLDNVHIINANYTISSWGFIFAMIMLIIILAFVITNITENYIAKKMPKYEFLEEDIEEELLILMNQLTAITDQEIEESILKYKGIKIANKIEDNYCILRRKVEFNACTYYGFIKENMKNLSVQKGLKFELLASEVKTAYLKAKGNTDDKVIIFNSLVEWMKSKVTRTSKEACEVMISFFIQNCEVFDEISE